MRCHTFLKTAKNIRKQYNRITTTKPPPPTERNRGFW